MCAGRREDGTFERRVDGTFVGCDLRELARVGNLTIGAKSSSVAMTGFSTYMVEKYIPPYQEAGLHNRHI